MVLEATQGCKSVTFLSLCTLAFFPRLSAHEALCALLWRQVGRGYPPAGGREVFGHVSRHFRPGAPVRKWHYDKGRYTHGRTSRPQSPATRVFSEMSAACTFSAKSIIQVHIKPKNRLVPRRSAVLTKIFPFSKEESNGKYKEDK